MLLSLMIAPMVLAVNLDTSYLHPGANIQSKLKQTKWGSIAMAMADIAKESQSPLKELQDTLDLVVSALVVPFPQ